MDTYHLKPENMRAPDNLSSEEIRKSLEELDNKIKILKGRVNATAADSNHTYHKHIAALETKRALIAAKLDEKHPEGHSAWIDIKNGIENLKNDIQKLLD